MMTYRKPVVSYITSLIVLFLIFSLTFVLDEDKRKLLFDEGGIVEVASALGYFLCAGFILYKGKINYFREYHYFLILIVMFGLRELDFHKRFTTMGILKTRFFISNEVSVTEKLVGFLIVLLLLYAIIIIYKKHFRQFIEGLKNHSSIHIGVLIILFLLGISKTLDGISRKLGSFGKEIGAHTYQHIEALEEVLELGIPMVLIIICHHYFDKQKI